MPDPRGGPGQPRPGAEFARYAGLGLQFAATVVLLAFAGYWVDQWLGTLPGFLLAGVFLGFLGAMISLLRQVPAARGRKR